MLVLGVAAVAGAAAVQPACPGRFIFLTACIAYVIWPALHGEPGRFRAFAAIALAAGACSAWFHLNGVAAPVREHTMRLACTVLDARTCADDRGIAIGIETQANLPPAGTRVLLRGRLQPFDAPRNPGEPDEAAVERERGVSAHMSNARVLRVLPPGRLTFTTAIATAHAWALARLQQQLAPPYAAIVAGELWGDKTALPPDLRAEFQETGTVHILVTAGLHLGVIALAAMALLRWCSVPRAAACSATCVIVWLYATFSGLHLPSLRAAVMASFALAAYAAGGASRSWNAYGAALLAVALFWPLSITGASFALSFSCVGAILLFADHFGRLLEHVAIPAAVREAIALTLATQLGTWPLTLSIFLIFSPYAVLANLLVVPVVGATMLLAAVQLAFAPLPLVAQAAAGVNSWLLAWIVSAVQTITTLPNASIALTPPPFWCIVAYDGALLAAAWCWTREARTAACALILAGATLVVTPPHGTDYHLRITVLDVGQADGIVIQTPLSHTLLVDAGGRLERGTDGGSSAEAVGERVVVPFLRRAGVHRIDAVLLSHPHGEHKILYSHNGYGGSNVHPAAWQVYCARRNADPAIALNRIIMSA